ncbi:MAG: response regulator [Planctomycetota bacterium]|nr:response regulator [Planctomycetota bacterium]
MPWLALGLPPVVVVAVLVWTLAHTRAMHRVQEQGSRAQVTLAEMQSASRALLSAREPFAVLAADWLAAVAAFDQAFERLSGGGGERMAALDADWRLVHEHLEPAMEVIATIQEAEYADELADLGVEQTVLLLFDRPGASAELANLRRLQRHLAAFERASHGFGTGLRDLSVELGDEARKSSFVSVAAAMVLAGLTIIAGGVLMVRNLLLTGHLLAAVGAREHSEEVVRERERDLRSILAALDEGVFTVDAAGLIRWVNPAGAALLGSTGEDLLGKPWASVLQLEVGSSGQHPQLDGTVTRVRQHGLVLHRNDGGEVPVDLGRSPLLDDAGQRCGEVIVVSDMRSHHELELQLRRSERLESLGQLAGGVAHDFNNMLTGILGAAEMLAHKGGTDGRSGRYVDTIITAAQRAAGLTRQLLDFSRRSTMQREAVDLHRVIEDSIRLLERSIDRRVTITCQLEADSVVVDGDASHLQNALINLALNARDAMPEGGDLVIVTANRDVQDDDELPDGRYCELQVSDTGSGMSKAVQAKIFDPFFTTKSVGRGSGLGLPAVLGTVQRHGGRVTLDSTEGVGTRFTILLPVQDSEATRAGSSAKLSTTQGRVLVVDDEAMVREMAVAQLESLGFAADTAEDGQAALERLRLDPDAFDLILLDLVMPRLSGRDTCLEIRKLAPNLGILLWSGYSAGQDVDDLLCPGQVAFVAKPCDRATLGAMLSELASARG